MDFPKRPPIGLSLLPRSEIFRSTTMNETFIPVISIHPDKIVCYNQRPEGVRRRYSNYAGLRPPEINEHKGNVSQKAERKIRKAINYLSTICRVKPLNSWKHQKVFNYKLAFVTLTLPSAQVHEDSVIMKQLFHQFLVSARKKWNMKNYVWRAEKQKNGNIHFHILVDKFVPWSELRDVWNNICNKLGYVDRYRGQMKQYHAAGFRLRGELLKKWSYKNQIKAYHQGVANDWSSPNSTDVHSIGKVSNIAAYVCKYMVKSSQTDESLSRLWGCSYELSRAKGALLEVDSYVSEALGQLYAKIKPKFFHAEHFQVIFVDWWNYARAGISSFHNAFVNAISCQFNVEIASVI